MPPGLSISDFYYLLPELVLTGGALAVLVADVLLPRGSRMLSWITLLAIAATAVALHPFRATHMEVAGGLIAVDGFAWWLRNLHGPLSGLDRRSFHNQQPRRHLPHHNLRSGGSE